MAHLEPLRLLEHLRGEAISPAEVEHLGSCGVCARRLEKVRAIEEGIVEGRRLDLAERDAESAGTSAERRERLRERAAWSQEGSVHAEKLLRAAAAGTAEELLRPLREDPAGAYALLFAAQQGGKLAVSSPRAALHLAFLIRAESAIGRPGGVPAKLITGEALLLESQAVLNLGEPRLAAERAGQAREAFRSAGADTMSEALCDYFEASARGYSREYAAAERLLEKSVAVFAEYGQDHWVGRAELALGTLLSQRGSNERALEYLELGAARLDPELDANSLAAGLLNRASVLSHLERWDEARMTYAQALRITRGQGFLVLSHAVQLGLAEIDFLQRRYDRALEAYLVLAAQARERGYREQVRFALLYVAECQARLGRTAETTETLRDLRREVKEHPFQSVALDDLFACLDRGDIDEGLIASVRDHLENPEKRYQARCAG